MFVDHDRVWEEWGGCKAQDKVQINPDALTQLKPTIIIKTMYHEVSEDDVKSIPRCDKKIWRLPGQGFIYADNDIVVKLRSQAKKKRRRTTTPPSAKELMSLSKCSVGCIKCNEHSIVNRVKEKLYKDANHLCWSFLCSEMDSTWSFFEDEQIEHYATSTLDSRNILNM